MEFNTKLRENQFASDPMLPSAGFFKQPLYGKEEFPFEAHSSKAYSHYHHNVQDFQSLDQFHAHGSSSNSILEVQNPGFDPFNTYQYGCSSSNVDHFCECKPFADISGGHGQVMDNFQSASSSYLNFPQRNPSLDMMGSANRTCHQLPLNCQEIKPVSFVVPDEVSCISAGNRPYYNSDQVSFNKGELPTLMRRVLKGKKKTNIIKGQWTIEEDRLLVQMVKDVGLRKWSYIAQMLPGRVGKQCRERWHNHLRPDIKKDIWSEEEDRVLIQAHIEIGNKWAEIAKKLPGRTENSIKNHWNATKRRQYSKRKCRSKYPRGSLLQEYIKSLNLDRHPTRYQRKSNLAQKNSRMKAVAQPQTSDRPSPTDRLVPTFEFNDDTDFIFDENMFPDGCSIDSLIDDIPCGPPVFAEKSCDVQKLSCSSFAVDLENESTEEKVASGDHQNMNKEENSEMVLIAEFAVKKEMDLVEMMSQVNEPSI